MDKQSIEEQAKWLRRRVYDERRVLWPGREVHPFEMLEPEAAAQVLGINFRYEEDVTFRMPGVRYEIGGLLDRSRNAIVVATKFGLTKARFTAAHELGHWLRHPNARRLHRDLPIEGIERNAKEPIEREADYFAAVYLMPAHFLQKIFRKMYFTHELFIFSETAAHYLCPSDPESLLYPEKDSLIRERTLASAKAFNGQHYECSLAEMFHVSVGTMAIRIRELRLVRE